MLVIKFEKGGKTVMTPTGYAGEACTKVTQHYKKYMAGDTTSEVPTPEMYEDEQGRLNAPVKQQEKA